MATVLATLVTYTEEAAPISTGMPTNAAQAAGMVRIPPSSDAFDTDRERF